MTTILPPSLAAALASGATTLARAWAVTRLDGETLGFTDHDRPLAFDGIVFEAASGLTAQALEHATGLAADSQSVAGALSSAAISEADLERGLYDGAEMRHWLVDWTDTASRVLLSRGRIGEVRRGRAAFEAEVTGLADRLNQPIGRAFLQTCTARLGDAACGVDTAAPAFRGEGTVSAVEAQDRILVAGLGGFASRWFDRGALTWTSGANAGTGATVKAHRETGGTVRIALWRPAAAPLSPGDGFTVTAGCDKSAAQCREKFANILNFRGFPLMPGDDWTTSYPNTGEPHDGGSLFRG